MDKDTWQMLGLALAALGVAVFTSVTPRQWRALRHWFREGRWIPWALLVLALVVVLPLLRHTLRRRRVRRAEQAVRQQVASGPTYLLLPRADWRPVDPARVKLWGRLAAALPRDEHIAFEIVGSGTELAFALHGSDDGVRAALAQIKAEWPGVQRRGVTEDPAVLPAGWHIHWCEIAPSTWEEDIVPLSADPLRAVLTEINGVVGRGRAMLQLIARADFGTRRAVGQKAVAKRGEKAPHAGVQALRRKEASKLEKRFERTFLQVTVRAVGMADTPERAAGMARGLARAVCASFSSQNAVQVVREGDDPEVVAGRVPGVLKAWADNELAALGHLTGADVLTLAPRLRVASAQSLPVAPAMRLTPADQVARFTEPLQ